MSNTLLQIISNFARPRDADLQVNELALLLDVQVDELLSVHEDPCLCYRRFTIKKRGGGKRQIAAPSSPLKRLQRLLLRRYLSQQPIHYAATAFRTGSSIATHARRHMGQTILLTVDLADFFPSTSTGRVRRWFRSLGWGGDALQILTRLCVYQGGLPQGAPTSPALSNLVNRPLDEQIAELAARQGAIYSRYCDDLAFSWASDIEPPAFRHQVEDILSRVAYRIQPSKNWRLQRLDQRPELTGVVIDGRRLRLPDRIVSRIRQLKSGWFRRDASKSRRLQGYRGLRNMLK